MSPRSVICIEVWYAYTVFQSHRPLMVLLKSWFTTGLNQLKAVPEDSLSPTSAYQTEPSNALSPFSPSPPSLMPLSHDEQLQLPLSREMAL